MQHYRRTFLRLVYSRRVWFEVIFLLLTGATILVALSVSLRQPGWQHTHDNINALLRTEVYAAHFKQGDLIPVWSTSDGYGMGSPMPLYYQKTFYIVSGAILLLTNLAAKTVVLITLGIFMLVGAYGMRFSARYITSWWVLLLVVPQTFIFSNYTFTDWLVRGDAAELAAMMLLPWLIWWCLKLVQDHQFSYWIVPIFVLLFFAHNATTVAAVVLPVMAYGIFLYQTGKKGFMATLKRGVIAVIAMGALVVPILLAQLHMNADYSPSVKIIENGLVPTQEFNPFSHYFFNPNFIWLRVLDRLTVQIDYGIWAPVALMLAVMLVLLVRRRTRELMAKKYFNVPIFVFLLVGFVGYIYMQTHFSDPVYHAIKLLNFLQFPWRLLALITPLGLLLVTCGFEALHRKFPVKSLWILVPVWAVSFAVYSPVMAHFQYYGGSFDVPGLVQEKMTRDAQGSYEVMMQGGEYVPTFYYSAAPHTQVRQSDAGGYYIALWQTNTQAESLDGATCSLVRYPTSSFESLSQSFQVTCNRPTTYALPISYSRYMEVTTTRNGHTVNVPFFRKMTDPRLLIHVSGKMDITVTAPRLFKVLFN